MNLALVDELRQLPIAAVEELLEDADPLQVVELEHAWREFWSRPDQVPPPSRWKHWLLVGGRGGGKTTALVQWVIERARAGHGPIRLIAGTLADARITLIENQESGILALSPPDFMPVPTIEDDDSCTLRWPNGVVARTYSAERPRRLRGKESRTDAYDDLAGMGPRAKEVWDMAQLGNRVWGDCRSAYTTTPEDVELIVHLIEGKFPPGSIARTRMVPTQNIGNLAPGKVTEWEHEFGGTERGQQELEGILVRRSKSSPFHGIEFAKHRVEMIDARALEEIAISVDPAEGAGEDHDEWGITVEARDPSGRVVTLDDRSGVYVDGGDIDDPDTMGAGDYIIAAAEEWSIAAPQARIVIVAEINRGEERVRTVINAAFYKRRALAAEGKVPPPPPLPEVIGVKAKVGKILRAGPLRPLYLQGMLVHRGEFARLEAQLLGLRPGAKKRPRQDDRADAHVHGVTYLAGLDGEGVPVGHAGRFAGVGGVPGRYHDDDVRSVGVGVGVGVGGVEGRNCDPRWG